MSAMYRIPLDRATHTSLSAHALVVQLPIAAAPSSGAPAHTPTRHGEGERDRERVGALSLSDTRNNNICVSE